jgi:TPR repeat protein
MARFEFTSLNSIECAAEGGAPDALFELGLMYCAGREVGVDFVSAHKWFNLAALRGNDEAKRYRTELAREMSRIDIARAQKMAREWISQH